MFDEVSDLQTSFSEIHIYNKLTHNHATMDDYQYNLNLNIEIISKYKPIDILYQPGILFVDVSDFHINRYYISHPFFSI